MNTPSPRDYAEELASSGCYVFPCKASEKLPAIKNWQKLASNDPRKVRQWATQFADCNWGVSADRFKDGALLVLDIDHRPDKDGEASLLALVAAHGALPPTFECASPSGRHLYFSVTKAVKQGVDVFGPGVDVRSAGGFVVAPGSVIPAGKYTTLNTNDVAPAPAWLVEACGAPREKAADRTPLKGIDPVRAKQRGIDYLATAPRSVKGAGGDQCAYTVAAKLLALGLDEAGALDLMLSEHWDDGCGWSAERLAEKVRHAVEYMQQPIGADAPEAVFEKVDMPTDGKGHPFDELNQEFAIAVNAPDALIFRCRQTPGGQKTFDRLTPRAFELMLAPYKFEGKPLSRAWLQSDRRRFYSNGVEFAPNVDLGPHTLNLYGGFAVKPAPGDWSLFREHIHDVIAGGDVVVFDYVMGWLATMVQRPGDVGQVALVLRGGRGTGKSTFGKIVGDLFGHRHAIQLSSQKHLSGNFNAHLACKVFVFADEAYFVGDKASLPRLKALITEDSMQIEYKGVDTVTVRSCIHLLLASNEEFVVPSGIDERRWSVIDVADVRRNDREHFGKMRAQMNAGGLAAMLHDLLAYDLSTFNIGAVPKTRAGAEQKTAALTGTHRWFFDSLWAERIAGEDWAENEPVKVVKSQALEEYRAAARERGEYHRDDASTFWKKVSAVLTAGGLLLSLRRGSANGGREQQAIFPSLLDCRRAFAAFLGESIAWGDG